MPSNQSPSPGEVLEQAILNDPDDVAAHAAYADWLTQQGDPRGEFIHVQLALEDPDRTLAERKELRRREAELLARHGREWAGAWVEEPSTDGMGGPEGRGQLDFAGPKPYRFLRGILAEVTLDEVSVACARAFLASPETRLVRRLFLGGWAYEEELLEDEDVEDEEPARHVFLRWPYFANLRVFQLGWTSDENYGDFCHFQCHLRAPYAAELVKRMPRLEELYLFADSVPTAELFGLRTLEHLRILQVYHCWEYPLQVLASNPALRNLTHLLFHPKASGAWTEHEAPYITLDGVRALLRSPHLTSLTHLRLRLTDMGDTGCAEIVKSGILRRLKVLDLRHGCISDAGAHLLASCPDVKNLEHLDISRNQLTNAGIRELRALIPSVQVEYQHGPDDDERRYLYEGDYE